MKKIIALTILLSFYTLICPSQTIEDIKVELNTPLTAEIGAPLVSSGKVIKTEAIKIAEPFEFRSGFFNFKFGKGDVYPLVKTAKGYKIYYLKSNWKDGIPSSKCIFPNPLTQPTFADTRCAEVIRSSG